METILFARGSVLMGRILGFFRILRSECIRAQLLDRSKLKAYLIVKKAVIFIGLMILLAYLLKDLFSFLESGNKKVSLAHLFCDTVLLHLALPKALCG